jgi:hypothetical protein
MNKDSIRKLINAAIAKQKTIAKQKAIEFKLACTASDKDPLFTAIERETLNFVRVSELGKFYIDCEGDSTDDTWRNSHDYYGVL